MRDGRSCSALVLAVFVAAACGGTTPTSPSQQGPLSLTVIAGPSRLGAPNPALLFFISLTNNGSETLTLTFPSSCQVMPYIAERRTGRIVHPAGGSWACATVITTLTLVPGEARIEPVTVATVAAVPEIVQLPPGDYVIYAKVDEAKYHLQSASYPFTLQ
jgi:hypothetical protein